MNCTIRVAKTKALISCTVTAQLISAFVFANADCWFSHAATHISCLHLSSSSPGGFSGARGSGPAMNESHVFINHGKSLLGITWYLFTYRPIKER